MMLAEADATRHAFPMLSHGLSEVSPGQRETKPVVARDITPADLSEVASLLHEGFPSKPVERFLSALYHLGRRPRIPGSPQFGHVLWSGDKIVGALLTIVAEIVDHEAPYLRCNVSCWYVRPSFRLYAPLLVLRTFRNTQLTHLNTSPAEHTWRTIAAQGFAPLCHGAFVGLPVLSGRGGMARIHDVSDQNDMADGLPAHEKRILLDHADYGCTSLVCEADGVLTPFIFKRRSARRVPAPSAQLIYTRSLDDLSRYAGPVGRHLALRGMPWLLASTNQKIDGIPGVFLDRKMPVYYKGPTKPRIGDLTYTEAAMFGF
jgi:hypothetical protein